MDRISAEMHLKVGCLHLGPVQDFSGIHQAEVGENGGALSFGEHRPPSYN